MDTHGPATIVFDSHCLLCSGMTRFVLAREAAPVIRFVAADSGEGLALAARHGLTAEDLAVTFLMVDRGAGLVRSDAALAVSGYLRAPWRWLRLLRVVPRGVRDPLYTWVARNRYRLLGRSDSCIVPPAGQRERFVLG